MLSRSSYCHIRRTLLEDYEKYITLKIGCDATSQDGWTTYRSQKDGEEVARGRDTCEEVARGRDTCEEIAKGRDETDTARKSKRRRRKLPEIPKDKKRE